MSSFTLEEMVEMLKEPENLEAYMAQRKKFLQRFHGEGYREDLFQKELREARKGFLGESEE